MALDQAYDPDTPPLSAKTIGVIMRCLPPALAAHTIAKSISIKAKAMADQLAAAKATIKARNFNAPPAPDPNAPVAYRTSTGDYISVVEGQANAKRGFGQAPEQVPVSAADAQTTLQKQFEQLTDATNKNAVALAAAANQNAQPPVPGYCPFQVPSQNAANGGVALAAAGAIYTRTWLGILTLLVPVIFARCQQNAPVNFPVVTPSSLQVVVGGDPVPIIVAETGSSGPFTVSPSNDSVKVAQDTSKTNTWNVTAQSPGQVVITAKDTSGRSGIATVTVVAGTAKKS